MRRLALAVLLVLLPAAGAEEPGRKRPDPKDVEIQVMHLRDSVTSFRERAARTIGGWGPVVAKEAVPALRPLLGDPDPGVRRAAAFALARMGEKAAEAGDDLAAALPDEEDPGTRANLAWALGACGPGRKGRAALVKALKDGDAAVRVNAATALGDLGVPDRAALAGLVFALKDDAWMVRAAAARSLGVPREKSRPAVAALARLLLDGSEAVRTMAARALGRIAEEDKIAEPPLLKALGREVERAAAPMMPRKEGEEKEEKPPEDPVLLDRLAKEGGARRNIVWALGRFGANSRDARKLIASIKEEDPLRVVRSAATTALDRIDITVMPAALEEAPRVVAAIPDVPWRMEIAGGCIEIVFRHER